MHKVEADVMRKTTDPGVITHSMLISLVVQQGPKNEAGRLFLEDGIEMDKVKEIRIEFLNILNIDHLWMLKSLVKLTLSHNVIERIENLNELVHLKELDLSFNRIKVIENLNNLTELEILLLYSNEISVVQGMDNLKKLVILNIGKNNITDWKHVIYLRDFKALRSLNTNENSCTEIDGYLDYLFAFVPQLLYYQYRMISDSARQSAMDKHHRVISGLEENEAKEQAKLELQRELENKIALQSVLYVENLDEDYLFEQMFSLDKEGRILSTVNEDTQNAFDEYRKSFSATCHELYELALQEHEKRTEEIRSFEIVVNEGKKTAREQARKIVDEVLEIKKKIFANINDVTETLIGETLNEPADDITVKATELFNEFNDLLSYGRTQLMSKEIILQDQMEDINEVFKINMTYMVNSFLETAKEHFSLLRNKETEYNNTISELILHYLDGFEDEMNISVSLSNLCSDRDELANIILASGNMHLQVINNREDLLISQLNNWLEEYINQLVENENKRNRQQILEISHFFGFQQEEFNSLDLLQKLGLTDIDLADDATLEND